MPLSNIEDAKKLSDQELADGILAAKRELFQLRMQQATRRLEKTHQFKHLRHQIAQMMTVARERERAAEAEAKASQAEAQEPVKEPTATQAPAEAPPTDVQEELADTSTTAQVIPESPESEAKEEE